MRTRKTNDGDFLDENNPALSLDKYIVERDKLITVHLNLDFKDDTGKTVLCTKSKVLVTQQSIQTPEGNVMCTVTHKVLSMMPTYEIHEGGTDGPILAIIKEKFSLTSLAGINSIDIEDPSGNALATATGSIFQSEYNIRSSDGSDVAVVTRYLQAGGLEEIIDMAKRPYQITITAKRKVPTLTLLGFLVVVELLAAKSSNNRGAAGFGAGAGVGFGMGGGFGGGFGGHR